MEVERKIKEIMCKKGISVYRIAKLLDVQYTIAERSLSLFTRALRSHELVAIAKFLDIDVRTL